MSWCWMQWGKDYHSRNSDTKHGLHGCWGNTPIPQHSYAELHCQHAYCIMIFLCKGFDQTGYKLDFFDLESDIGSHRLITKVHKLKWPSFRNEWIPTAWSGPFQCHPEFHPTYQSKQPLRHHRSRINIHIEDICSQIVTEVHWIATRSDKSGTTTFETTSNWSLLASIRRCRRAPAGQAGHL